MHSCLFSNTLQIVDKCPECDKGHLDLFQNTFDAVGGSNGLVSTSYKWVTCDITTPLVLRNKEGKFLQTDQIQFKTKE